MIISFRIVELPKGNEPYRLATDIEGELLITSDSGTQLFKRDGVLLVEFAIFCKKWLREKSSEDFYYASMDFEEEPIIAFRIHSSSNCYLESVWLEDQVDAIPLTEVKEAMRRYIDELRADLDSKYDINIMDYEGFSSV